MFGIGDRVYTLIKQNKRNREIDVDWKPEISNCEESSMDWYCFVPQNVARGFILRKGLIPKSGNIFLYKIYSLNLIKECPNDIISNLQVIYDDIFDRMKNSLSRNRSIGLVAVSLGNVLALRAAGNLESKIEKIVSIAGGGKLGLSAWDSILTSDIAKRSGCSSAEEYEERLSIFSPVNYIDKIFTKEIVIRLGTRDLLIPYKYGQELAGSFIKRAKETNSKIDYKTYSGADHSATLLLSALFNLMRE